MTDPDMIPRAEADTSKEAIAEILDALDSITGEEIDVEARAARNLIVALVAERDALEAYSQRLRYVLGGVASAIDTGRNEPLMIWRKQIEIARAAIKEQQP